VFVCVCVCVCVGIYVVICSFAVFDSMNGVLAGALRGCGKQKVAFVCVCVCVFVFVCVFDTSG
jgi:hypothetical protein